MNLVQPLGAGNDRYLTKVELRFDGGDPTTVDLGPKSRTAAGQTVTFPKRTFHRLDISIVDTNVGDDASPPYSNGVGLAEVRLQARRRARTVVAREITRMPTDLVTTAVKQATARPLVYSMARLRSNLLPPHVTRNRPRSFASSWCPTAARSACGATPRLGPDAPDADRQGVGPSRRGGRRAHGHQFRPPGRRRRGRGGPPRRRSRHRMDHAVR